MDNLDNNFISSNIKNFDLLSKTRKNQLLLYILAVCEIELSSLSIDVINRSFNYEYFFVSSSFKSKYFNNGLIEPVSNIINNYSETNIASTFTIFSELIDFIDQLPFENLLDDTEDNHVNLLERIRAVREKVLTGDSLL